MKLGCFIICFLLIFFSTASFGQNKNESTVNFIDKLLKTPIDVQYGWSAIDDDGKPFRELLNLSNWNIGFLPSRVAVLKSFHPLLKAKLDFAFNSYQQRTTIDNAIKITKGNFFTTDLGVQVNYHKIIGTQKIVDPYTTLGIGFTKRSVAKFINTGTLNFTLGTNIWPIEFLGIYIESAAKIGLVNPFIKNASNYFQHSIGVTYSLGAIPIKKSKKNKFFAINKKDNSLKMDGYVFQTMDTTRPAAYLKIKLIDSLGKTISETRTQANGYFVFKTLQLSKTYTIDIDENDPDFSNNKRFYLANHNKKLLRVSQTKENNKFVFKNLITDNTSILEEIYVEDEQEIAGNLFFGKNQSPLAEIKIIAKNESGNILEETYTDKNGNFSFIHIPKNTNVIIEPAPNQKNISPETEVVLKNIQGKTIKIIKADANGSFYFNLLHNESTTVDEMLIADSNPLLEFKATITNDKNENLANTIVYLKDENGNIIATGRTDGQGKIIFRNLPPDKKYLLSFDEKDAGLNRYTKIIIKSENGAIVKEVYRNEKGFQYEVLNNDKSLLSEIKAEDGSIPLSFIASIQDENLKLIPNLLVIVKEKNGEELYRTTTDNNGKLKLNQLVKDKNYDLEFDPNDPRIKSIKKIIIKSENNKLTKELVRKANGFHFNVLTSDKINLNELSTEEVNLSSIKTSKNSNSLAPKDEKVSSPKEQETEYHINLKAYVFDENNNILNHLAVIIKNKEGTVLKIDTTNMYGAFYVKDLPPQQDFEVEFDEKDSRLNKANKISIKSTNDTTLKQIEHKPNGYKLNLLKSDTTLLQKSHSEVEPSIQLDFKASVLDDKNKPLPNFTITLKDENNHIIKKQTTDKNGKIVFDHLLGSENHKLEFDENDPRIKNIGKILIKSDDGKMTREVKRVEKGFEYSLNKIETDLMDEYKITELENIKVEKLYKKKGKIVKVKEELSFNTGDAVLQQEQKEFINKINKILKQTPELKLEVSGYADSRSGEKTNLLLSEKRAKTVGDYLIEQGIPRPRIIIIGYGESRLKTKCPDFSECTEAQHAENRRVEFRLFVD